MPGAGYLGQLVTKLTATPPKIIMRSAYNDPKVADWFAERIHGPVVLLPYAVGGAPLLGHVTGREVPRLNAGTASH